MHVANIQRGADERDLDRPSQSDLTGKSPFPHFHGTVIRKTRIGITSFRLSGSLVEASVRTKSRAVRQRFLRVHQPPSICSESEVRKHDRPAKIGHEFIPSHQLPVAAAALRIESRPLADLLRTFAAFQYYCVAAHQCVYPFRTAPIEMGPCPCLMESFSGVVHRPRTSVFAVIQVIPFFAERARAS